jgi:hypothetical protein
VNFERTGGDDFTSAQLAGATSDVVVSFTRHAMQRLQERFGIAVNELRKLLHNFFSFESFSTGGKKHWRMMIPLRYCFVGTFEGKCFVVKTVFFNISEGFRRRVGEVKRLRIMDINCPP